MANVTVEIFLEDAIMEQRLLLQLLVEAVRVEAVVEVAELEQRVAAKISQLQLRYLNALVEICNRP